MTPRPSARASTCVGYSSNCSRSSGSDHIHADRIALLLARTAHLTISHFGSLRSPSPRECAHCCQALGGSVAQTLKTLGHQSRCAAGSPGILLSIEAKVACSVATTCAPSPTAAATRLIEPERTSPIAKIPRRLVSSGLRVSLQSPPVSTKPFASNATPDPDNQSVFGSAPMNKKRC